MGQVGGKGFAFQYGGNFDFGNHGKGFSGNSGKGFGKGSGGKGFGKGIGWPHPNGPPSALPTPAAPISAAPTLAPIAPLQGCPRLQSLGLCNSLYYLCPVTCGGCLPI